MKRRSNPGKGAFKRCVEAVEKRGGAYSPAGVCAAAGRRKYGAKKFAAMAKKGRKNASLGSAAASATSYLTGVGTAARVAQGIANNPSRKNAGFGEPLGFKSEKHKQYQVVNLWGTAASHLSGSYWTKGEATKAARQASKLINEPVTVHGPSGSFNVSAAKRNKNPAEAAAEAFEDFHGYAPTELVTVKERVHYHKHLAAAGELPFIDVITLDGTKVIGIEFDGDVILAFNEKRNQLFIKGGDQRVDLRKFGINPKDAHETETLGQCEKIGYDTRKDHLGDEGGEALYVHTFRTTNQNGRHVTIKIARYPDLIYRVRDEALEFSGGSYKILPEGVDR